MRRGLHLLGPFILGALALGLVLLLSAGELSRPTWGQRVADDGSQEVHGTTTVGQTFVAAFNGLYRVDVFLNSNGQIRTEDVMLHLRASPEAREDLRSSTVNASTVTASSWVAFEFPPIPDSGGRSYYFFLESPASSPGNAPSVFRSVCDLYRDGTYYLNGAPSEGDLTFSFYSRAGLIGWLRGLPRLLSQDKPFLAGQPACYGTLAVLCLVLLVFAIRGLFLPEFEDGMEPVAGDLDSEPPHPPARHDE